MPFCDDWSDRSLFLPHLPKVLPGFNELFIKCFEIFWWKQSRLVHDSHCQGEDDIQPFADCLHLQSMAPFFWMGASSSKNPAADLTCEEIGSCNCVRFFYWNVFNWLDLWKGRAGWVWDFYRVFFFLVCGCLFVWVRACLPVVALLHRIGCFCQLLRVWCWVDQSWAFVCMAVFCAVLVILPLQ